MQPVAADMELVWPDLTTTHRAPTLESATFQEFDSNMSMHLSDDVLAQHDTSGLDFLATAILEPQIVSNQASPEAGSARMTFNLHGLSHRLTSSHTASYFSHFHPFLPILHRPTFRLSTAPSLVVSIVVAIGITYTPSHASSSGTDDHAISSNKLWEDGAAKLQSSVSLLCHCSSTSSLQSLTQDYIGEKESRLHP